MKVCRRQLALAMCVVTYCLFPAAAFAQDPHDHSQMNMPMDDGWQFMQDGVIFVELNHQQGPRGGTEVVAPNWWMGMASRDMPRGRLTLNLMLSLDPATVGKSGYRELFQAGEALAGRPLVDRQHPHDLFMQLAASWRTPLGESAGVTIAGGPVGEPALGPVPFMHRRSAFENPTAPLSHHTFDSTHVAFGVVTAALDSGPFAVEASIFNGREPDENRWDMEFGRLDSVSGRLWYRPSTEWEFQVSSGRLVDPEQLEPGNIVRTTASAAWTRKDGDDFFAVTAGAGRNDTGHGSRNAVFVEGTRRRGTNSMYGRFEALQTETSTGTVVAATGGAARDVFEMSGLSGAIGADATWYRAPDASSNGYGPHPFGVHVFFRLRPAARP